MLSRSTTPRRPTRVARKSPTEGLFRLRHGLLVVDRDQHLIRSSDVVLAKPAARRACVDRVDRRAVAAGKRLPRADCHRPEAERAMFAVQRHVERDSERDDSYARGWMSRQR